MSPAHWPAWHASRMCQTPWKAGRKAGRKAEAETPAPWRSTEAPQRHWSLMNELVKPLPTPKLPFKQGLQLLYENIVKLIYVNFEELHLNVLSERGVYLQCSFFQRECFVALCQRNFHLKKRVWNEYEEIFNLLVVVYKYEKWGKRLKSQTWWKHKREGELFLLNESKNLNRSAPSDDWRYLLF